MVYKKLSVLLVCALLTLTSCSGEADTDVSPERSIASEEIGNVDDMQFFGLEKVKEEYDAYWDTLEFPQWHTKKGVPSSYEEGEFKTAEYGEGFGKTLVGEEYSCVWMKEYLQAHSQGDNVREKASLDKLYAQLEMDHYQWPLADENMSKVLKEEYQKAVLGDSSDFQMEFESNCLDYQ